MTNRVLRANKSNLFSASHPTATDVYSAFCDTKKIIIINATSALGFENTKS